MKITNTLLLVTVIIFAACKNKEPSSSSSAFDMPADSGHSIEDQTESSRYSDGSYCASVEYYNPRTGTNNSYQLEVEVEDGELTQINWPNGGWLDESHFSPEELDDDGTVSFTSDKGYEYTVTIESEGPCMTANSYE